MTPAQTIMLKLSTCRQRINELLGVEDRSAEQDTEMETLTADVSKREPELRAALAAEDDKREVVTTTGGSENRERLELRSKTGLADFLRAAAGGTSVSGAALEYCESLGVPTVGHLPMAIFGRTTPETRAITPGPAVNGPLQPTVPYVFERSAAASLGIAMRPSLRPSANPENHHGSTGDTAVGRRSGNGGGGHGWSIRLQSESPEVSRSGSRIWPSCRAWKLRSVSRCKAA